MPAGPLRPDSIDLLFLRSFPDPFERVQRDKNKGKRGKNLHENTILWEFFLIFLKLFSVSHFKNVEEDLRNKSIESGLSEVIQWNQHWSVFLNSYVTIFNWTCGKGYNVGRGGGCWRTYIKCDTSWNINFVELNVLKIVPYVVL